MPRAAVAIRLPHQRVAPGYRASLVNASEFVVNDVGDDVVLVAPREGAGVVREYLRLDFLCDRSTDVRSAGAFAPVKTRPPQTRRQMDVERLEAELDRLRVASDASDGAPEIHRSASMAAEFAQLEIAAALASQQGTSPEFLADQAEAMFAQLPDSSWWYLSTDPTLLSRAAFFRTQLGLRLSPDLFNDEEERTYLRGFGGLTMTNGVNFTELAEPALLAFSPACTGLLLTTLPHAIVLLTGDPMELRAPWPATPQQLFEPRMLSDFEQRRPTSFHDDLTGHEAHQLLQWWIERLNVLLSHALDPTGWVRSGKNALADPFLDVEAQTAWLVSLERLIADGLFLLGQPSATDLVRVQVAFDLLDKAEALIGFGKDRSGQGFQALLRRRHGERRLDAAWSSLPASLRDRFRRRTVSLYDALYARVRSNTAPLRLTRSGVKVGSRRSPERLNACSMDDYVAALCRAVRNSSHGLLDMLRTGDEAYLLSVNTSDIPQELPDLAAMVMFGLVADAENLCAGTWADDLLS